MKGDREERGWKPKWSKAQSPPHYLLLFTINLHNFTFLLAANGSEERRTTACAQNSYYLCLLYMGLRKEGQPLVLKTVIIIQSKFFFLFIGREPTTWPANNCLQIMVCSCVMPSNCVWLQIIFCTCIKETVLFSFLLSFLRENGRLLRFPRIFIKKTNSVIK